MSQSLNDALKRTSVFDTEDRIRWLESSWSMLNHSERVYAMVDIAMRLGRLTASSNEATMAPLVSRFRRLESSELAHLGSF